MIAKSDRTAECEWCQGDRLLAVLGDSLAIEERDRWDDHLSVCQVCRAELEQLASTPRDWVETRTALVASGIAATGDTWEDDSSVRPGKPSHEGGLGMERATRRMLLAWLEPVHPSSGTPDASWLGKLGGYLVRRVVGYGGMGVVLEGFDPVLRRVVAIKAMHPHLAAIGTARQRFIREARAAAAIVHPNVVPIHGVDADHQPPFLIMQMVRGETLQARVDRTGPLPVEDAMRIAYQIAEGLAAAHSQGLAHRDVKPANILLESGTERALLTDFGVARALDDATVTASGSIAGTPEYMSPEQARGESVDARSDQFSLGSVLYFMLTGRTPFRGDGSMAVLRRVQAGHSRRLREIDARLPVWLQCMIDRLHAQRPEDRYIDANQLAWDLRQCLAHCHDPSVNALPNRLRQGLSNQRRTWWMAIAAVVLVVGGGLAGWFAFLEGQPMPKTDLVTGQTDRPSTDLPSSLEWDPWNSLLAPIHEQLEDLARDQESEFPWPPPLNSLERPPTGRSGPAR